MVVPLLLNLVQPPSSGSCAQYCRCPAGHPCHSAQAGQGASSSTGGSSKRAHTLEDACTAASSSPRDTFYSAAGIWLAEHAGRRRLCTRCLLACPCRPSDMRISSSSTDRDWSAMVLLLALCTCPLAGHVSITAASKIMLISTYAAEAKEEEPAWEDDGTLPVDASGSLPFFCVDAHEEHSTPGTLYLLGKVHGSSGVPLAVQNLASLAAVCPLLCSAASRAPCICPCIGMFGTARHCTQ